MAPVPQLDEILLRNPQIPRNHGDSAVIRVVTDHRRESSNAERGVKLHGYLHDIHPPTVLEPQVRRPDLLVGLQLTDRPLADDRAVFYDQQ